MDKKPKIINDPLTQAKTDVAEKIGVAGWKEAFQENIIWIRRVFQIALFLLLIAIFYYNYKVVQQWLRSGYKDEIEEIGDIEFLPFSNVSICAQVYFNETFVRESVTISERIENRYKKEFGHSLDTLYEQLTLFLVSTSRPKNIDPALLPYFSRIIRENPQVNDLSAFAVAAIPKCESMLNRCWFGGKEFNCCDRAVQSLDDDGICYLIVLNYDSDNAAPSNLTVSQTELGPSGGLIVEASMNLKEFPWVEDVMGFGYRVFVSPVPFGVAQSPLGAPHKAETFIKVTPTKHQLSTNCAPKGHLSLGEEFMYYDPEGVSCGYRALVNLEYKYAQCHTPSPLYRPNVSMGCSPAVRHILSTVFEKPVTEKNLEMMPARENAKKQLSVVENDLKAALSVGAKCPSHCSYWTYSSSSSFFYLDKPGNNETEDRDIMFSKIHVYYGDFGYRQYNQVKQMSIYVTFCNFGNVAVLCWGMSIVSFFHFFFYVPRYFLVRWNSRKQRTRVHPIANASVRNINVTPAVQIVETER